LAAFSELEGYNGRVKPVGKLYVDKARVDQAIIFAELIIPIERTFSTLVAKPPKKGNFDLG
jgi:hypothetical protein